MYLQTFLALAVLVAPLRLLADEVPSLAERHLRWLEESAVLLTAEEQEVFDAIGDDDRRDAFVELFWRARDPHRETPRNEFRDTWEERLALARQRFGTLVDIRAQVFLLIGEPAARQRPACSSILLPIEIWTVGDSRNLPAVGTVVFVKDLGRQSAYSIWSPDDGLEALVADRAGSERPPSALLLKECDDGDTLVGRLDRALSADRIRSLTAPEPDTEWLADFQRRLATLDAERRSLAAELTVAYPGRHRNQTIVEATISVPRQALAADGPPSCRFVVDGEVRRQDKVFESFRYRFDVPKDSGSPDSLLLVVERYLRPGAYELVLRVESLDTQGVFSARRPLNVPIVAGGSTARGSSSTPGEMRSPSPAGSARTEHSITLLRPPAGLQTGNLRVEARTTGEGVSSVVFELDGRRLMRKRRPPWSVEIDFGRAPRIHQLTAIALGADDEELARDQIRVNAGPQHFEVRLVEPTSGGRYEDSLRARAIVDLPRGSRIDRIEFYLNERLLSTLYQPPFVQPLELPSSPAMTYVRAVAFLDDGHSAESLVFINSPQHLDHVDIDLVELYTTVVDRRGRPVEGLTQDDFEVFEGKIEQEIRRFEHAGDRPFHAAVILDTSTSMIEEMRHTEKAALAFFRNLVTPRDRAAVVTFADEPRLVVPFTNDLEILAGGLAGIKAEGETALHDSIIFALYHFGGLRGQRALILLSDGEDSISHYSFEEALTFARQTGVAIFSISLDIPTRAHEARSKLMRLSNETGGQYFFISRTGELERVYRIIERELRSQYLIAYQSSLEGDDFRHIEVRLSKPGLEAKTIAGYDP